MTVPFYRTLTPVLSFEDTHHLSPTLTLFVRHLRFLFPALYRCVSLFLSLCNPPMHCLCACVSACDCVRTCVCVCECVSVCMWVCVRVRMRVRARMRALQE